jgi:hypothetical protein
MMDKSRRMSWVWHATHVGNMRNFNRILVAKPEGKRPLERSRYRWEYIIKTRLKEIDIKAWTGFIGLMMGNSSRLL